MQGQIWLKVKKSYVRELIYKKKDLINDFLNLIYSTT